MTAPLVEVRGLRKRFELRRGPWRRQTGSVHAVDGLDFTIAAGETLGLVGESGCGKTTTGRILARLTRPSDGHVLLHDPAAGPDGTPVDLARIDRARLGSIRRRVQMIFQDPYASLNPRRTVLDAVTEPLHVQAEGTPAARERTAIEMIDRVGLRPARAFAHRFPHELSGGQRQRVAIARALVVGPDFVVADEPTSMLDSNVRVSIMELMLGLARDLGVSYLFITHDLAVARYMCDRIAVMYLGKIVEIAPTETLLADPQHPYTRALRAAVPTLDPGAARLRTRIHGDVATPTDPPPTCRFLDRCPRADSVCLARDHPPLEPVGAHHTAACYHPG